MNNLIIKHVELTDLLALQDISKITFVETFGESNSKKDIEIYLNNNLNQETLAQEISSNNSAFYFGYDKDKLIAYLKINVGEAQNEQLPEESLEIERIYVLQEYQGKKCGYQLFQFALEKAKEINAKILWLGVWEKNFKAIEFYNRLGMKTFGKHTFLLGEDEQTDILMKISPDCVTQTG